MSIFNSLKPQGGNKLHPFDLSRRDVFSVKSGVLNVNFVQHTIPESKYEVNHAQITRVDPIQTASFARMSENYEYYFVPYSQIFHDFEKLYYERGEEQRNYANSEFSSQYQSSLSVPTFNYYDVVRYLMQWFVSSRLALKIKEQSVGDYQYFLDYEYSVQDLSDLTQSVYLPFDIHGQVCIDEMIKLFDMLGYGNLYPLFRSFFSSVFDFTPPVISSYDITNSDNPLNYVNACNMAFATELCNKITNTSFTYDADDDGVYQFTFASDMATYVNKIFAYFKLELNSDDEPIYGWNASIPSMIDDIRDLIFSANRVDFAYVQSYLQDLYGDNRYPSIIPLAAYQKVFCDIYRNTQFDTSFYATLFNFDWITSTGSAVVPLKRVLHALMPRFRQYKKDVFTGVFPNAQFGSIAVGNLQNPVSLKVHDNLATSGSFFLKTATDGNPRSVGLGTSSSGTYYPSNFVVESGVSALAIRQALSLQRYKERILRAGNRITALQAAVFGDKSRFVDDEYVQFIGAEHNMIDFNAVAATSDAGKSEVGQLGSNGVGTHVGKSFEYHSHDFGIIIGIYYILPESEYEAYMIEPMNTKTVSNDFYKPDFMNLGLSPVWNYHFNFVGMDGQVSDAVLGYLANYWEYKTSLDKVHGNFYASLPQVIQAPGVHGPAAGVPNVVNIAAYERGANSYYVTPRAAASYRNALTLGNLYVNPHDIDTLFYVNSDFTLDTDQFKVNCNHDVKALLPMSVIGLPEY